MKTVGLILSSCVALYSYIDGYPIILLLISLIYKSFQANIYVQYAFIGIKCGVAFLITKAAINMIFKMKKKLLPIIVLITITILMIVFEIFNIGFSSIFLILIGGAIGIFANALINRKRGNKA